MSTDYSEQALSTFLDWLGDKGLVKQATAKSRKIAALKILSALDGHEKIDLRSLDRDATFQRFVNKLGSDFTPDSLVTYKSRFTSALEDFLRYKENPAGFKPGLSSRSARKTKGSSDTGRKPSISSKTKNSHSTDINQQQQHTTVDISKFVFPIPLRDGVVVQIHNIPSNLTAAEAERISAVIKALAIPS